MSHGENKKYSRNGIPQSYQAHPNNLSWKKKHHSFQANQDFGRPKVQNRMSKCLDVDLEAAGNIILKIIGQASRGHDSKGFWYGKKTKWDGRRRSKTDTVVTVAIIGH